MFLEFIKFRLTDILHLSQQDLKNLVYQRKIKAFRLQQLQEARFLVLVQDMSLTIRLLELKTMVDEQRRKKVKGSKTRLSQKGFLYADIGYFCEDVEDVQKFGRLTITFVVFQGDVLAFDPKVERFVEIKKSSRYNKFKQLLDTAENDLIGERDGVWFFVGKEIDGYQGWVYWRDGLVFYQLQGLVPIVED